MTQISTIEQLEALYGAPLETSLVKEVDRLATSLRQDRGLYDVIAALDPTGLGPAAARRLELNHATVGRRLTALETALGARLLDRRPNGCELTPTGRDCLEQAERMEAAMLAALRSGHVGRAVAASCRGQRGALQPGLGQPLPERRIEIRQAWRRRIDAGRQFEPVGPRATMAHDRLIQCAAMLERLRIGRRHHASASMRWRKEPKTLPRRRP